jgi:zinc protease
MKTNLFRTFAVLLSLAVSHVLAGESHPLPKDLPPFGEDKPLPVPKILKSTTPEGLTLWLVPREGFPKVSVLLAVRGGTAADPKGREGIAQLLADTLKGGTASRTSRQIAEELQSFGGALSVKADDDAIYLQANGLGSGVKTVLAVLADVARNASFPVQEVELAKANALQQLQVKASTPNFLAEKVFASAVYGKHPYHVIAPEPAVISSATPEVLKKEFARRFRPASSLLVITGAFDPEVVSEAVAKAFGGWKAVGPAPAETPPVISSKGREILFVPRPGSVQSNILVGRIGPHRSEPGFLPALVANSVYGSSFASRLTANIREDKGYSYSPGSALQVVQRGGLFEVRAQVRNEVTAAALLEIIYELDRMGVTDVSADELKRAQRFQSGFYLLRSQSQDAFASLLGSYWVVGMPPEAVGEFVPKVNAVTVEQVREAGKTLFASGSQTIVVVGDEKVKAELEQFGPVREIKP